jgi:hypothetical protein
MCLHPIERITPGAKGDSSLHRAASFQPTRSTDKKDKMIKEPFCRKKSESLTEDAIDLCLTKALRYLSA